MYSFKTIRFFLVVVQTIKREELSSKDGPMGWRCIVHWYDYFHVNSRILGGFSYRNKIILLSCNNRGNKFRANQPNYVSNSIL